MCMSASIHIYDIHRKNFLKIKSKILLNRLHKDKYMLPQGDLLLLSFEM